MSDYVTKSLTVTLYDGTKKKMKVRGKTEQEAQKKKTELETLYTNGILTINSKTTFKKWAEEWLSTYVEPIETKSNYSQKKGLLENHIYPSVGNVRLCDLRPHHLQRMVNRLAKFSSSQINKTRIVVNGVISTALTNKLISDDLTLGINWPKGTKGTHRPLTEAERELFLESAESHPRGAFFLAMYYCGLRDQEARALMWGDVDLKKKVINVCRAVKKDTSFPGEPKSKAGYRTIPIPMEFYETLSALKRDALYVFPSETGVIIPPKSLYRFWGEIRGDMDDDLQPYCLRHNYCTMLAEGGVDLKTAQYLMGHSSIAITAEIYSHVSTAVISNAQPKIENVFQKVSPECPPSEKRENQKTC